MGENADEVPLLSCVLVLGGYEIDDGPASSSVSFYSGDIIDIRLFDALMSIVIVEMLSYLVACCCCCCMLRGNSEARAAGKVELI